MTSTPKFSFPSQQPDIGRPSRPLRLGYRNHSCSNAAFQFLLPVFVQCADTAAGRFLRLELWGRRIRVRLAVGCLRHARAVGRMAGGPLRCPRDHDNRCPAVHCGYGPDRLYDQPLAVLPVFWNHPQRLHGYLPGTADHLRHSMVQTTPGHQAWACCSRPRGLGPWSRCRSCCW